MDSITIDMSSTIRYLAGNIFIQTLPTRLLGILHFMHRLSMMHDSRGCYSRQTFTSQCRPREIETRQ